MPSIAYMNQSAPFWDFVASLEQQGSQHPLLSQDRGENNEESGPEEGRHRGPPPPGGPFGPWGWGSHAFGGGRGFPFRGPPPPAPHDQEGGENEKDNNTDEQMKDGEKDNGEGPSQDRDVSSSSDTEGCPSGRHCGRRGRRGEGRFEGKGRCGGRGRHAWGGPGHHGPRGHHGPPGPPPFGPHGHHGPHHEHRRGGPGGFGGRGGWGGPWGRHHHGGGGFNPWAFAANWLNPDNYTPKEAEGEEKDYSPEADIFDTPTTYVVHISLPGAKKEDVGVNWDAEKSELSVAGVVYRPGDEDFLKTLAMDERKVGPFERKIRLGTRANPAQIDAEGITAKLEDGILRVEVPKRLEEGFVEVRKVDIE